MWSWEDWIFFGLASSEGSSLEMRSIYVKFLILLLGVEFSKYLGIASRIKGKQKGGKNR